MGFGQKDEGIKKYKLVVTEQSRDVKYSIGESSQRTYMQDPWTWTMVGDILVKGLKGLGS